MIPPKQWQAVMMLGVYNSQPPSKAGLYITERGNLYRSIKTPDDILNKEIPPFDPAVAVLFDKWNREYEDENY